jgi:hypothetical protein
MKELLDELETLGFYRYTDPRLVERIQARTVESGYLYDEAVGRTFFADAEHLAEGGVKDFINAIVPFLAKQNVLIRSVEENFNIGGEYSVTVNGRTFVMYTQEELETAEIWELTTIRAFSMVNTLLKQAEASERLHYLYGGNDMLAVFLTPDMYRLIARRVDQDETEKPRSVDDQGLDT